MGDNPQNEIPVADGESQPIGDKIQMKTKSADDSLNDRTLTAHDPVEAQRSHENNDHQDSPMSSVKIFTQCDMCANYEAQLTHHQEKERELRDELAAAKHLNQRYLKELNNERASRADFEAVIEQKIKDKSEEVHAILASVKADVFAQCGSVDLSATVDEIKQQLSSIRDVKESLKQSDKQWEEKFQSLLHSQVSCHEKLLADEISLPNDVDELQALALQLQEQLISQVGSREYAQKEAGVMTFALQEAHERIDELQDELHALQEMQPSASSPPPPPAAPAVTPVHSPNMPSDLLTPSRTLTKTIDALNARIEQQNAEMHKMHEKLKHGEHKCEQLRSELDTSVSVQRDFVKLSQELQMQLEQIRQNETDVRWQFAEDATECAHCRVVFSSLSNSLKLNCRHCGKIHCDKCLCMTVPAGPQRRAARVCQLCHTLLNKQERPFFSRKSVDK